MKPDCAENGELILRELAALREQVAALVRHLRDNKRKARQRVGTVRERSAERSRIAGHRPSEVGKARIRKLLLR